ncbi:MAG: response regulator transcription factor [Candidatus Manganitrophus sp.]|nr:response regulator transcription factor [Candidatus Manganitrophus morganii]MDC4203157.1 response regulator transcription factor [Candidatus Manganitrophus sp.]WDT69764.1 MAG: response regulator transcription factor [Candidatus Manganitrophus sp.]WDT78619.1 MAG: response regulator transcription factor [Candidatus Manganitrophus sp.]
MPQKILVVDDEADLSKLVAHHLQKEGFEPLCVANGAEALKIIAKQPVALVILDVMMPGEDGLQVCRKLRAKEETASIPILFLTAKDEESDKIVGLELGADDYVTKPFSPKELMARVKALLRRTERKESASSYAYRELVLDVTRHEVRLSEKKIPLTAKEFSLLEHLLKSRGIVLTRDHLLNTVWGYDYFGTTRTVDVHIRRLREKIPLLEEAIETVPSLGYKLTDEE